MKKIISTLLVFVIILTSFSMPTFAEEFLSYDDAAAFVRLVMNNNGKTITVNVHDADDLEDLLAETVWYLAVSGMTYADYKVSSQTFTQSYVQSNVKYKSSRNFEITYTLTVDVDTELKNEVDRIINTYNLNSLSPIQKLVTIYKYMCENINYDYDNYSANTIPDISYTSRGALIKKTAVCEGYSEAFMLLCNSVGIKCEIVSGRDEENGEGHTWNVVELDGLWYFIDVTWDSNFDNWKYGYAYFLKGTSDFKGHILECTIPHKMATVGYNCESIGIQHQYTLVNREYEQEDKDEHPTYIYLYACANCLKSREVRYSDEYMYFTNTDDNSYFKPESLSYNNITYTQNKAGEYCSSTAKKPAVSTKKTKKNITIKWKKIAKVSGYQVQYSTNKSFTKKTTVTKNTSKTTLKANKLKKKKYYIRIRTYKTVYVNEKKTKLYSNWSKVKTVKM